MDSLTLGPFALPVERLPGIAAVLALLLVGALASPRHRALLSAWSVEAVIVAVIGARLAFISVNWPAFEAQPLTALYFWQGGFIAPAGAVLVLAYTFWRLRRHPETLLRAGIPLAVTGVVYLGTILLTDALKPDRQPLPDITVQPLDGRSETLRAHLGQVLVVNLWASWCPPCRREMPMLITLAEEQENARILLINQGESRSQVVDYLEETGLAGTAVRLDPDSTVSQRLGVTVYPTTLVYDRKGELIMRRAGEVSRATVLSAIATARRDSGD